jgi:hypothetical protein
MSYYSGTPSQETPEEALKRIWQKCLAKPDPLREFVFLLTWCDWSDSWRKEDYDKFNDLVTEHLRTYSRVY